MSFLPAIAPLWSPETRFELAITAIRSEVRDCYIEKWALGDLLAEEGLKMNAHCYFIEQLDLAAQQLHIDGANFSRFALILIDNCTELMLHHRCEYECTFDIMRARARLEPLIEKSTRRAALGRHLDDKIRFCRQTGVVTEDESDFIGFAHEYRNEAYHVGITHEDVLLPIAWQYHELACVLYTKIMNIPSEWILGRPVSDAVERHAGKDAEHLMSSGTTGLVATADSLRAAKPPLENSFATELSSAALGRIEQVASQLDYLVEGVCGRASETEVIKAIQFDAAFFGDDPYEMSDVCFSREEFRDYEKAKMELYDEYTPPIRSSPIERWERRAHAMRSDPLPGNTIKRFWNLQIDMEPFAQIVRSAARKLDDYEQSEFDFHRGK